MKCLQCGDNTKNPKFCSRRCSSIYNGIHGKKRAISIKGYCLWCGGLLRQRSHICCSRECGSLCKLFLYVNRWRLGMESGLRGKYGLSYNVRRFMFLKTNYMCEICGYNDAHPTTGHPILDIHHIDGNCLNNKEVNLEVICPNCHRKTDNHGSMNTDNTVTLKDRLYLN